MKGLVSPSRAVMTCKVTFSGTSADADDEGMVRRDGEHAEKVMAQTSVNKICLQYIYLVTTPTIYLPK